MAITPMRASSLALLFGLVGLACKPRSSSTGNDAAVAVRDGQAIYSSLCAVCHGADALGYKADNAPSLVNPTFLESASDEQIRRSIVDGRPGTSMAAYGKERGGPLAPEEVTRVVSWIRSHGPAPKAIPPRGPGDPTRGAPVYAANCERCHGTADKRANAVHLANPRFLEAASDPFIGWAISKGRPGTPMEAWQGKLTDPQIDDVVAYVRSFAKPAVPESLPPPTGTEPIVMNPEGKAPAFTPRSTPCMPNTPCTPDNRFVSADQVKQAFDAKRRMVIIDARPPSDWMRVHIPGAVSIPYHDLKRLDEVPKDGTWVIAYCACPHHLSGDVVDALRKRGVQHAVILDEGILEWHRRGYPVVAAPGVERPPPALVPPPAPADAGRR
jgi:mono/diheme cytochrome c family protein/rhodanese-related sulfurtransferase